MPIFEQGYQHWKGTLSSHAWRWLAITRNGLSVQMKNRSLRFLMLLAWLPALILIFAMAVWGLVEQKSEGVLALARNFLPEEMLLEPSAFRQTFWVLAYAYFFHNQMFFIMLLVALAGPGLISRDLRMNALPMYFARPLTRLDYFLGKLGVIGAIVAAVAVGPAVIAYVVGVGFSLDIAVVKDTYPVLFASVAYGLVITLSVGTLILAMSALTKRSLYVGIAWACVWVITGLTAFIMTNIHRETSFPEVVNAQRQEWIAQHPPPDGIELRNGWPQMVNANPEARRWYTDWQEADMEAHMKAHELRQANRPDDWWPLCSYVNNLERLGDALLGTDAAWVKVGAAYAKGRAMFGGAMGPRPPGRRGQPLTAALADERSLANSRVLQTPWQWSAGILAVLMGLSLWVLLLRVRSLDRLK